MLGDAAWDPGALAAAFRDAAPGQRGAIGLLDTAHRDGLLGPVLSACREGRAQGEREARRMAASLVRDRLVDPAAAGALAGALVDTFAAGEGERDLLLGTVHTAAPANGVVPARGSLDGYSWAELSAIAHRIARAASDREGFAVAKAYHLCGADGTLDGSQSKSFRLPGGILVQAQVIGFRHDRRADGAGVAGVTFTAGDCVAERRMEGSDSNYGGWEGSELRAWMNSELLGALPEDLHAAIVPVAKMTNNAGRTTRPSSVTATCDSLWLPSLAELVGARQLGGLPAGGVWSAEDSQYQLFSDRAVRYGRANEALVRRWGGRAVPWWERSPHPRAAVHFCGVVPDGHPRYDFRASSSLGVAPYFCL